MAEKPVSQGPSGHSETVPDFTGLITFWFTEVTPRQRFAKDPAFDRLIRQRFGELHGQAAAGELFSWRDAALGSLAEVILLDQFSRNLYRDSGRAFAWDPMALCLAQEAIRRGQDAELEPRMQAFLYMPYMHSESPKIHEIAMELFSRPGLEESYRYEVQHRDIINRFGRYPHRNALLGRESSAEELRFLEEPGSSF